ncbi:helix-turn-helix transcriptional regulator [Deinococcus cellulosilyticus]|uniref:helix-turn-helix transcriptional regulator n=1 Tax=Deinococcus cellulosilyticus TaxID=401558 RepID=UPI00164A02CF|nr:WYL domain-containing protein [Deinococcus cellulosilyticus]
MEHPPSARLLKLLALLQQHRVCPGPLLSEELHVSRRTLRRDVEKLRQLGYGIEANPGPLGGYRMVSRDHLPPLLFEEDEAVVIAVALLGTLMSGGDLSDASLRAWSKLHPLLPEETKRKVSAVLESTLTWRDTPALQTHLGTLGVLGAACRRAEVVRFGYHKPEGSVASRRAEPFRLVHLYDHWYLVAFDTERDGWRIFRVDRIRDVVVTRQRFEAHKRPFEDPVSFVLQSLQQAPQPYQGEVIIKASLETIRARLQGVLPGRLEPLGEHRCRLTYSSPSLQGVLHMLVSLDADFDLEGPEELLWAVSQLGLRFTAGSQPSP